MFVILDFVKNHRESTLKCVKVRAKIARKKLPNKGYVVIKVY